MWLGTDLVFDAFKFYIVETPHGIMQIHGYPYDATGSTFIVEMNDAVWHRAGFDALAERGVRIPARATSPASPRSAGSSRDILDGHAVHANNSRWISFTTVRNERWHHGNVVILGDAAHTAHFSIGSGTKLAMEDALALAACLHEQRRASRRRSRRTRRSASRWSCRRSGPRRRASNGSRTSGSTSTRIRCSSRSTS